MYDYNEELGKKLNELLEKNYDAEKGYKKAAENAKNSNIKFLFENRASERYRFGHEIKAELAKIGIEPDKGGSVTGAAHRTWMDIKSAFTSDDDEAMLEAAIRGDKAAIDEYKEVLGEGEPHIPEDTALVLSKQMIAMQNELDRIKQLEEQM